MQAFKLTFYRWYTTILRKSLNGAIINYANKLYKGYERKIGVIHCEIYVKYVDIFRSNERIFSYCIGEDQKTFLLLYWLRLFFFFFYLQDAFETSISLTYLHGFFSNFQGICNFLKYI